MCMGSGRTSYRLGLKARLDFLDELGGKTKGARHKATIAVEELLDGQVEQVDPERLWRPP